MKQIHNGGPYSGRMPLYLQDKELEQKWLLPDLTDQEVAEFVKYEIPSESPEHWPVYTTRSTKPGPDHKSKVDPWEWTELLLLSNDETIGTLKFIINDVFLTHTRRMNSSEKLYWKDRQFLP